MKPKSVLILTQPSDVHAPPVAEEIRRRGMNVCSIDLADFPAEVSLEARLTPDRFGWNGLIRHRDQTISLASLQSVWWRRPQRYQASPMYEAGEREFVEREAYRGLVGVLESIEQGSEHARWVSRPQSIKRAELKPLQLAMAQQIGLSTPRTLVTNDPQAARSFYEECEGKIIIKAVSKGIIAGQEQRFLYTSEVTEEHLSHLDGVRATAHLFQEIQPKIMDLRVVVIGRQIFAVEIYSQKSQRTQLDWRKYYPDLSYGIHTLSCEMQEKVLRLVQAFDLQFSSMDLLLTPEGEYRWIELNPNGQFYWLQMQLGDRLPLKEAMADLLTKPEEFGL